MPEIISEQIYTYGFFDESVTRLVLHAVREDDVVVDVGAHFGYFTLLFSHLIWPVGRVVAVEPTPSTYAVLSENVARLTNVTALNMAAGRESGRLSITDFGLEHCAWNTLAKPRMNEGLGLGQRIEVSVARLDNWFKATGVQPNVIKIDAENFEAEVIAGLEHTIEGCLPCNIMETNSEAAAQAGEWLLSQGYVPHVSEAAGSVEPCRQSLREANDCYKDILFVPAI